MGITISGENNNDRILASDGVIDQLSGFNVVGVMTATSFTGNLTGDVTGNLTGNINNSTLLLQTGGTERIRITGNNEIGIAGANYGSAGQVLTSGGSGSAVSWTTISGTTINNNADNRLITGSGTANTLEGEANLTFDGTSLDVNASATAASSEANTLVLGHGSGNYVGMTLQCAPSYPGSIFFTDTDSGNQGQIVYNHSQNELRFYANAQQKLTCGSAGVTINNGSLFVSDSIIHSNDTNTKIRFPDADTFTVETGGSERLRIASGGQVIIGDDDIDKANGNFDDLIVGANTSTTETHGITIVCGNAATNGGIAFSDGSAGGQDAYRGMISYQHNDNHMQFRTNATERLRIKDDGSIGIGINTPQRLLHQHIADSGATYHAFTNSTTGSGVHDGMVIGLSGSEEAIFWNYEGTPMRFATSGAERLRIDSSGRVFIGNDQDSSPYSWNLGLQVTGTSTNAGLSIRRDQSGSGGALLMFVKTGGAKNGNTAPSSNDQIGGIYFNAADGTDVNNVAARISGTIDGTTGSNNTPGRLTFSTTADNANSPTERLRIASNGKIYVKGNGGDSSTDFSDTGTFFNLKHDTYGGRIGFSNGTASGGVTIAELLGYWGSNKVAGLVITAGGDATNRDDGAMSFYTRTSGGSMTERLHIGTEGQIVAGYRVGTSTVRSNQPVAFHSARVSPDANPRRVSTGQRCNLFVGSNSGWAANDGGTLGLGGSETGGAGVEAMWSYLKGGRQSSNGWEYAGYFEMGTSPWSGSNMAKRVKIYADGQIEVYPTDNTFFSTQIGGAQRMIIKHTGGGNIEIENSNGTMTFDTSSDYRLKKDEVAISNALSTVKALKPYQFTWKHDDKLGQGFLAHEAQAVLPDIGVVSGTKDAVHTKDPVRDEHHKIGDPIYQQIDYSKLVPLLTAALQEETAKREALEARVAALESS